MLPRVPRLVRFGGSTVAKLELDSTRREYSYIHSIMPGAVDLNHIPQHGC